MSIDIEKGRLAKYQKLNLMAISDKGIQVLEGLLNGEPSNVSDILFGFQHYPKAGSEDDIMVRKIEQELVNDALVMVTERGGTNRTINGYATLVISPLGIEAVKTGGLRVLHENPMTKISKSIRLDELDAAIQKAGLEKQQFRMPLTVTNEITVYQEGTFNNFYINLQENKDYFTVRRTPLSTDQSIFITDVSSWNDVLRLFNIWLNDLKASGIKPRISHPKIPNDVINALSTKVSDVELTNQGLTMIGLLGYVLTKRISKSVELIRFDITFRNGQKKDIFYTTNESKERLKERTPVKVGTVGYVFESKQPDTIQLQRYWSPKSFDHLYVSELITSYPPKDYKDETKDNPIFIYKDNIQGTTALYLYSTKQGFGFVRHPDPFPEKIEPNVQPPKKREDYLPFFLSEGRFGQTQDQLDFQYDIESLASIISMKDVEPPLAIGLFGKWGTGKSFFMQKLNERIAFNSESSIDNYIKKVVQVKFNSWHYSDTNLWASLITQIFESLNDYAKNNKIGEKVIEALYKNLNLTNIQFEQTKKRLDGAITEKKNLESKVEDINEKIKVKKQRLQLWNAGDLMTIVYNDPLIKSDFTSIADHFKNEKLIEKVGEIDQRLSEVDTAADRLIKSFEIIKDNKKGRWLFVWLLFGVFLLVIWLINGPLEEYVSLTVKGLTIFVSGLAAFLAPVKKLYPYYRKVTQFYERLRSLKETIEREKEKVRLNEHAEIAELELSITRLETTEVELQNELLSKAEEKQRLETELKDIGSGKMLAHFLEKKSLDENYFKQLGIISWIRKDFSKLNDLFEQQRSIKTPTESLEKQDDRLEIDRIVLYIDDLDRCNEEIVVKVLEAIHLILAFPLFVVVVGVDPRWMNNAINKKYKDLFGSSSIGKISNGLDPVKQKEFNDSKEFLAGIASSYDYLEKIFQIPFSLKPINKTSRENLLAYLIRNEMSEEGQEQNPNEPTIVKQSKETKVSSKIEESKVKPDAQDAEETRKVRFTNDELELMQNLSPLFGHTPRGINRYVNIYRILKCHGSLDIQGNFSKEEMGPIMFVLAIVVGYSVFAREFIHVIFKADDSTTLKTLIVNQDLSEELREIVKRDVNIDQDYFSLPIRNLKGNLELISRFSFRTIID